MPMLINNLSKSRIAVMYRADSIEAMLAAIPSRFNIEKSLSLDSPPSSRAFSSQRLPGAQLVPSHGAAVPGMSAIPSRRSRDVPGLQPDAVPPMTNFGPHGDHVTPYAASNGEMPRYCDMHRLEGQTAQTDAYVLKHLTTCRYAEAGHWLLW